MSKLIETNRSLIVSADLDTGKECNTLAKTLSGVPGIGGFKIGITAGLDGLYHSVNALRYGFGKKTVIIYDHQKAGTDIPDMGVKFAQKLKACGCDAAILFPFAGPATQTAWTKACQDAGLCVIVGSVMTHPEFLESEGGYISDMAPQRIFELACDLGVRDFVVPGTKITWVKQLRALLDDRLGAGEFDLYAPGFVTQGGDITDCGKAAGSRFHPIVGSGIYGQATPEARRAAAQTITQKLAA